MELERKQLLGVLGVVSALFGLLVLPLLVERLYGVSAVKVAFVVIIVYAAISWWMRR